MERKAQVWIGAALIVALAIVAAVALTSRDNVVLGLATEDPNVVPLDTVTTQGTGISSTAPDQAKMFFGVQANGDEARATLDEASGIAAAIVDAIKGSGVDDEDIQTTDVSIWPDYDYDDDTPRIVGYRATMRVAVTIKDIEAVGDVIEAASSAGANEIDGPIFSISDDNPQAHDALQKAVEDARARAEAMAEAAGKSVGDVLSMTEAGIAAPPIQYRYGYADEAAASMDAVIEPGQLDVSASVTVVFELK